MTMDLILAAYVVLLAVLIGCFLRFAKRRVRLVALSPPPESADFTTVFALELQSARPSLEISSGDTIPGAPPLPLLRRADLDLLAKVNAFTRAANPTAYEPL